MNSKNLVILFLPITNPDDKGIISIPYALLYLERMIRDLPVEVKIIDEQFDKNYLSFLEDNKERILLAGVSCLTGQQIEWGIRFSKTLKSLSPETVIIWGGWHASLMPEETVKEYFIDAVVSGQGEVPFREIVKRTLEGKSYDNINGVVYKHNGQVIVNMNGEFLDFNNFPPINLDLIDIEKYVFKHAEYERTICYIASHGCPYYCGFCICATIYKRKWFNKSQDEIISSLKYFKEKANIDSVFFWDENFFIKRDFAMGVAQRIIDEGLNIRWDAFAHAGNFIRQYNTDDLKLLRKSGLSKIPVGAETGNEEILKLIDKKQTLEDVYKFVELIKPFNITPVFSVILCFPENPHEDVEETLEMIRKAKLINPSLLAIFLYYTPYPGTKMYEYALIKGFKPPVGLEAWKNHTLGNKSSIWFDKKLHKRIEYFDKFYLIFANPNLYKLVAKNLRPYVYILNKIYYPLVYMRFRYNFFKFPVEAASFLFIINFISRILMKKFKTGDVRGDLN
ncbi:MAG: radical SAM protein [Bacteroidales bacterium]|nr:radical SAM protein [Bacteroidales bacterium]